jgi:hypothetical protein
VHAAQTERRRVRRFVRRVVQVLGLRPEGLREEVLHREARLALPVRHCSAGFQAVAAVLPELLRPQAESRVPLMALRPVQPMVPRLERAEAARPVVPAEDRCPERPFVAAAPMERAPWLPGEPTVRALQQAEPLVAWRPAEAVPAQRLGAPAARAEAAGLPEQAVPRALEVRPKVARAVSDAAAGPQPVAASGAVALPQEEQAA